MGVMQTNLVMEPVLSGRDMHGSHWLSSAWLLARSAASLNACNQYAKHMQWHA